MEARRLNHGQRIAPTLIICPTSVVDSWENEILLRFEPAFRPRWARHYGQNKLTAEEMKGKELVITTYGSLLSRQVHLKGFSNDYNALQAVKKAGLPLFTTEWR